MVAGSKRIELAKALAAYAHDGQIDKGGTDYINHPLAVAEMLHGEDEKIVGLLHDVLEDTFVQEATIRNLFGGEVADAVISVTRRLGEDYFAFVKRAKDNEIGRKVKIADLRHNMDLSRIGNNGESDSRRRDKYAKALEILES